MSTVVLLSGGLDSAVALSWALANTASPHRCISFFYGQRHARERASAELLCEYYKLEAPQYIQLQQPFAVVGGSSLTSGLVHGNPSTEVVERTSDVLPPTFVPGRNLTFLSLAYGYAYTNKATDIVGGWNAVDYSGYPDCRPEFLGAFAEAANIGLDHKILLHRPLVMLSKQQIIEMGIFHKTPFGLTWSCYTGNETPCGVCDSCQIRADGFTAAGIADPALSPI